MSLKTTVLILLSITVSTITSKYCNSSHLRDGMYFFSIKENFMYYPWNTYVPPEGQVKFMMVRGEQNIPQICKDATKYNTLQEIIFYKINLQYMEPGLFNSKHLEHVFIQYNQLKNIPLGLFNGTSIRSLVLSDNQIGYIDDGAFKDMTKLEAIALDFNKLKSFNPEWFVGASVFYELSFIHNELRDLPAQTTKYMAESFDKSEFKVFGSINFDNNGIQFIHQDAFSNLRYFGAISLSNNKILELPDKVFSRFEFLLTLYMNTNSFICFTNRTVNSFHGIKRLFLGDNHINGDCVQRIKKYFDWKNDLVYF
uniref:Relaxin receptor 2-like n=1 Tax=Diabrotica virgifera virgifera TaxID=50390 RepID=A0A6P7GRP3_DIAVI